MADVAVLAGFGGDTDKAQPADVVDVARRRVNGRYLVDEFGADPQLQDLVAPLFARSIAIRVTGGERLPSEGPALLVTNRGLGVLEPTALSIAVRQECGRRLRIVGTLGLPVVSDLLRKLGSVDASPVDLGALLRAGRLAALPLGVTWRRTGGGVPPTELLVAALGHPVIPVRVRPGGPFGLPLTPWRVHVGEPLVVGKIGDRDPLEAAELAEATRASVAALV